MYVEYRENKHPFAMDQWISITDTTERPLLAEERPWCYEFGCPLTRKPTLKIHRSAAIYDPI